MGRSALTAIRINGHMVERIGSTDIEWNLQPGFCITWMDVWFSLSPEPGIEPICYLMLRGYDINESQCYGISPVGLDQPLVSMFRILNDMTLSKDYGSNKIPDVLHPSPEVLIDKARTIISAWLEI